MNTENRNKPGQHWLALHCDNKGKCNFFDSFGNPPKYYNKKGVQGFSEFCGFYCI